MKKPYPNESVSFGLSMLIWSAWMALIFLWVPSVSLSLVPALIAVGMGFFLALYEVSRGRLIWRRLIKTRARWRRGNWHFSHSFGLAIGNVLCFAVLLFSLFWLVDLMRGEGGVYIGRLADEWRLYLALVVAMSVGELMSGNKTLFERTTDSCARWWLKKRRFDSHR